MSTWLLALGLSPHAAWWVLRGTLAVLAAIAFGAAFSAGYHFKAHEVTQQELKREQARSAVLESLRKENDRLVAEVTAEKARDRVVYRTLTKKVPYVVPEIVEIPVSGPAVCTVSNDFVRLWNDALTASLSGAPGGTSNPAARSGADRNASSGIRPAALLDNHVENAESCHDIRRQLSRLIAWHKANDR